MKKGLFNKINSKMMKEHLDYINTNFITSAFKKKKNETTAIRNKNKYEQSVMELKSFRNVFTEKKKWKKIFVPNAIKY